MFSQIPNQSFEHTDISAPIIQPDRLPEIVRIKPLATLRQLDVSFPVGDYRDLYRAKPLGYLGNLVGHEGEGSLLSALKREGLAQSLSAGSSLGWRGGLFLCLPRKPLLPRLAGGAEAGGPASFSTFAFVSMLEMSREYNFLIYVGQNLVPARAVPLKQRR